MTLKHFINEVVQLLQEHLGEHYIVETATTLKNNSVELSRCTDSPRERQYLSYNLSE